MPKKDTLSVEIPELRRERVTFTIVGDSSLIVHKWSDKAKREMLDKQQKKATPKREGKNPEQDFRDALYILPNNGDKKEHYGFPSIGFKKAAIRAANDAGMNMTDARRFFHVVGEFIEIKGVPTIREDMVKLNGKVADIRYRPEFKEWEADINVDFNPNTISASQIINLFNLAGFGVGIGDWRPEKDGTHGMFHIKSNGRG